MNLLILLSLGVLEHLQRFSTKSSPDKNYFLNRFNMKEEIYHDVMDTLFLNGFIDEDGKRIVTIDEWLEGT